MPKPAPVRGAAAGVSADLVQRPADVYADLVHRPDDVYAEITKRLRHLADFQAMHELRMLIPSVDLETVAAEVSIESPPLDSIVTAASHLDITHELHDCWSAPEDDLEKLQYIHRLVHLAGDHHHHHSDLPARQPAHVRELQPRGRDGKYARVGNGNGRPQ